MQIGEKLGEQLKGGEVIELIGDVGSGKTVFTKGLAKGAGSPDNVASPSFTISRVYSGDIFDIHHFDFYRLSDPGIMMQDIAEVAGDENRVVVVEWSDIIQDVLPENRYVVSIQATGDETRKLSITFPVQDSE
jgi:tRNA threonylcarbamoyladenosine biosynthesis protein TsaE